MKSSPSIFAIFFAMPPSMGAIGYERSPDWPKLGSSMLIATAMVVAIRTAK
ncbi:MAG: hypothetical protein WA419_17320 [Silvibacterium sp.]